MSEIVQLATNVILALHYGNSVETSLRHKELKALLDIAIDCPEKPNGFLYGVKPSPLTCQSPSVCMVSGGADSTIQWFLNNQPPALYFDMGQPYAEKEKQCLKSIGIPFRVVAPNLYFNPLVNFNPLVKGKYDWKHIIPGRNFLFLTLAAERVSPDGTIYFGVTSGEGWNSGKGDKSALFVRKWMEWYEALTGKKVFVETMVTATKGKWLETFKSRYDIDVIRKKTITCFSEKDGQCGECQACLRKYLSFISIGMDICDDFLAHPARGCKQYIDKYKVVLNDALLKKDFTHYSEARCIEDLAAIAKVENKWHRSLRT